MNKLNIESAYVVYNEFMDGSMLRRICCGVYSYDKAVMIASKLNRSTDDYHNICKYKDANNLDIENIPEI